MATLRYTMPMCRRVGSRIIQRPLVFVKLINPKTNRYQHFAALIDTGSDQCIFPARLTIQLGYTLEAGTKTSITDIHNCSTDAWIHSSVLGFRDPEGNEVPPYQTGVVFSRHVTDEHGILGLRGFLDHFKLTIDHSKHLVVIKELRPKPKEEAPAPRPG